MFSTPTIDRIWQMFTDPEEIKVWGCGAWYEHVEIDFDLRLRGVLHHRVTAKNDGSPWDVPRRGSSLGDYPPNGPTLDDHDGAGALFNASEAAGQHTAQCRLSAASRHPGASGRRSSLKPSYETLRGAGGVQALPAPPYLATA